MERQVERVLTLLQLHWTSSSSREEQVIQSNSSRTLTTESQNRLLVVNRQQQGRQMPLPLKTVSVGIRLWHPRERCIRLKLQMGIFICFQYIIANMRKVGLNGSILVSKFCLDHFIFPDKHLLWNYNNLLIRNPSEKLSFELKKCIRVLSFF